MDTNSNISRADFEALLNRYREIKHSINNSLAVIMALSELAERNPAQYERLAKTVLARCPDIVAQMQEFQRAMQEKLKLPE